MTASSLTIGLTVPAALKEARRLEILAGHTWLPRLKQLWLEDARDLRAAAAQAVADAAVQAQAEAHPEAVPVRRSTTTQPPRRLPVVDLMPVPRPAA